MMGQLRLPDFREGMGARERASSLGDPGSDPRRARKTNSVREELTPRLEVPDLIVRRHRAGFSGPTRLFKTTPTRRFLKIALAHSVQFICTAPVQIYRDVKTAQTVQAGELVEIAIPGPTTITLEALVEQAEERSSELFPVGPGVIPADGFVDGPLVTPPDTCAVVQQYRYLAFGFGSSALLSVQMRGAPITGAIPGTFAMYPGSSLGAIPVGGLVITNPPAPAAATAQEHYYSRTLLRISGPVGGIFIVDRASIIWGPGPGGSCCCAPFKGVEANFEIYTDGREALSTSV